MTNRSDKLIVALDTANINEAKKIVHSLSGLVSWFKVGKQLFTASGPDAVKMVKDEGCKVFLDLKFHDIPNTVASALRSGAEAGADMINVHALGGLKMMETAAKEMEAYGKANRGIRPILLAVTALTSMDQAQFTEVGIDATPEVLTVRLARLAARAGLDGVIASPDEAATLKSTCGNDFLVVTPGVRPAWASKNDQIRVMTPKKAIAAGADKLVIGRPITASKDMVGAAKNILAEMG